jgi:hypothetical protein
MFAKGAHLDLEVRIEDMSYATGGGTWQILLERRLGRR